MLGTRPKVRLDTERLVLRPPLHGDYRAWAALRQASVDFLTQWEPTWAEDHLTRRSFTNRVYWAQRSIRAGTAVPLFLIRRQDEALLGAITLDNIRRGPSQSGTAGYWIGAAHALVAAREPDGRIERAWIRRKRPLAAHFFVARVKSTVPR